MKSISGDRKYATNKSYVIGSYMFDIEERITDDIEQILKKGSEK